MKKFYSILVIALMAVALVACGSNEKKSKEKEADAQELSVEKKAKVKEVSVEKMAEKFAEELFEAFVSEDGDALDEIVERMEAYEASLSDEERVIFNAAGEAKAKELEEAMYE